MGAGVELGVRLERGGTGEGSGERAGEEAVEEAEAGVILATFRCWTLLVSFSPWAL